MSAALGPAGIDFRQMKAEMLARYCARGEKLLRSTRSRRGLVDLAKDPGVVMAILSKSTNPDAPRMLDALCEHEMKRYLQRTWRNHQRSSCYQRGANGWPVRNGKPWLSSAEISRGFSRWWTAKKREASS